MHYLRTLSFVLAVSAFSAADAAVANTESAGAIAAAVDNTTDVQLTVTGPINAADLQWIADKMPQLVTLDLSGAEIVAYDGDALNGQSHYDAGFIPGGIFSGSHLETVILPAATPTAIGDMTFAQSALTAVPENISAIGNGAFSRCDGLTEVTLPEAVYGSHAFAGCVNLKSVDLTHLADVPEAAFAGCTALTDVRGTAQLVGIGAEAFLGCKALTAFGFGKGLVTIGAEAFANTSLGEVALGENAALEYIGPWAFAYNDKLLTAVLDAKSTPAFGEGIFFDCAALETVQLPEAYDRLPSYFMKGVPVVTAMTIPEGVSYIGAFAMKDAKGVSELTLPSTLGKIDDNAMEGMDGLRKITASSLGEVPLLGDDVWVGLPQSEIVLLVNKSAVSDFQSADQWKEFQIVADQSGIDDVTAGNNGDSTVSGRFSGTTLQLRSQGADIAAVSLYSADGRLLTVAAPADSHAEIPTEYYDTKIFVIAVRLADGTTATLKLLR